MASVHVADGNELSNEKGRALQGIWKETQNVSLVTCKHDAAAGKTWLGHCGFSENERCEMARRWQGVRMATIWRRNGTVFDRRVTKVIGHVSAVAVITSVIRVKKR